MHPVSEKLYCMFFLFRSHSAQASHRNIRYVYFQVGAEAWETQGTGTAEGRRGRVWRGQAAASGCHLREAGGAQMRLSGCGGVLSLFVSYSHSHCAESDGLEGLCRGQVTRCADAEWTVCINLFGVWICTEYSFSASVLEPRAVERQSVRGQRKARTSTSHARKRREDFRNRILASREQGIDDEDAIRPRAPARRDTTARRPASKTKTSYGKCRRHIPVSHEQDSAAYQESRPYFDVRRAPSSRGPQRSIAGAVRDRADQDARARKSSRRVDGTDARRAARSAMCCCEAWSGGVQHGASNAEADRTRRRPTGGREAPGERATGRIQRHAGRSVEVREWAEGVGALDGRLDRLTYARWARARAVGDGS